MKYSSALFQLAVVAMLVFDVQAWRGDTEAFDGPIGEYVRTLKKSYKEDGTLDRGSSVLKRDNGRRMKSGSGSGSKTPAPTTSPAPTCPPSRFVTAPSKRAKVTRRSRKTRKSAKSCKTGAPTTFFTCPPTAMPTAPPTTISSTKSSTKASSAKSAKIASFSCKSKSVKKSSRRATLRV